MSESNGKPNGVGRPRLDIDPDLVRDLAGIGCTMIEIAGICGCSVDTLENNFSDAVKKGREEIRRSLRRAQLDAALHGTKKGEHYSPTMLIWLGKQILDQRDKQELSGPGGGPVQHEHYDFRNLSTEQLSALEQLVESAVGANKAPSER